MSTTPLGYEKPDPGASDDEWGYALNRNFDRLDAQLQDKANRGDALPNLPAAENDLLQYKGGQWVNVTQDAVLLALQGNGGNATAAGFRGRPQNAQSADYVCTLADAGKHILHPASDVVGRVYKIPSNASVPFGIGTELTFVNRSSANIAVTIDTDTMRRSDTGDTTSLVLMLNGMISALKIGATEWLVSGTGLSDASLDIDFLSGALDSRITFTRASSGSYFDAAGMMQTATTDTPRFDYDPVTLQPRGLLIEEQSTNMLRYSEDLTNAVWDGLSYTVTPNAGTAPSGAMTAALLTADSVTVNTGYITQQALTLTVVQTASVYWKPNTSDNMTLQFVGVPAAGGNCGCEVGFFSDTGSFSVVAAYGGASLLSAELVSVGGGWWRVSIATDYGAPISKSNMRIFPFVRTASPAVGDSGYVWGAQIEASPVVTSYIPTSGSTVTRAADIAVISGTNWTGIFNTPEGTFYLEAERGPATGVLSRYIGMSYGAGQIYIARSTSSPPKANFAYLDSTETIVADLVAASGLAAERDVLKVAGAYKTNNFAMSANGAAVVSDATGAADAAPTELAIGRLSSTDDTRTHNACIRRIRYYPRRLPDATLQALTS